MARTCVPSLLIEPGPLTIFWSRLAEDCKQSDRGNSRSKQPQKIPTPAQEVVPPQALPLSEYGHHNQSVQVEAFAEHPEIVARHHVLVEKVQNLAHRLLKRHGDTQRKTSATIWPWTEDERENEPKYLHSARETISLSISQHVSPARCGDQCTSSQMISIPCKQPTRAMEFQGPKFFSCYFLVGWVI